jgi:uncharacterized protein
MMTMAHMDYAALDRPEVLHLLFHPRPEWRSTATTTPARDELITVDTDVVIGARFHMTAPTAANILFFHGNGEIVADYDDLGPVYNRMGVNFLAVDYRGYGRSTGKPTVRHMMQDSHVVFNYVLDWLKSNSYSGPVVVMGRSLGSASALELAASHPSQLDGLIIESGFAYAGPLLQRLGINLSAVGFRESEGFTNLDKIRDFHKPVLIIHAELDHIIPFADAQTLYDHCPAADKILLKIPEAGHNDIFARGLTQYLAAIKAFSGRLGANR